MAKLSFQRLHKFGFLAPRKKTATSHQPAAAGKYPVPHTGAKEAARRLRQAKARQVT
jgi:hypothetical protein